MGSVASSQTATSQVYFKNGGDYYALMDGDTYLTSFIFSEISSFQEGLCWVNKGDLYGYIDTLGKEICPFVYTDVSRFHNGFAAVSRDSTLGFINSSGEEICPLKYNRVSTFSHGLAGVQVDSLWAVLDTNGKEVSSMSYQYPPMVLSKNFVVVCRGNKWGVINHLGKEVYPFQYDLITREGVAYMENKKHYLGLL